MLQVVSATVEIPDVLCCCRCLAFMHACGVYKSNLHSMLEAGQCYAGASHDVCLSGLCNTKTQPCHRAAMPMQAAVKHLELAGPITHEMILPTVIICICDLIVFWLTC